MGGQLTIVQDASGQTRPSLFYAVNHLCNTLSRELQLLWEDLQAVEHVPLYLIVFAVVLACYPLAWNLGVIIFWLSSRLCWLASPISAVVASQLNSWAWEQAKFEVCVAVIFLLCKKSLRDMDIPPPLAVIAGCLASFPPLWLLFTLGSRLLKVLLWFAMPLLSVLYRQLSTWAWELGKFETLLATIALATTRREDLRSLLHFLRNIANDAVEPQDT